MTRDEMQVYFNKAFLGMKAQGFEQALSENGSCVYIAENGNRDCIAHIYHDGFFGLFGEQTTISYITADKEKRKFLHDLMVVHDNGTSCTIMVIGFQLMAAKYKLEMSQ